MANTVFPSFKRDLLNGAVAPGTDTLKVLLCTSSYTPSTAHSKRSDITNEVSGTGYTAGGATVTGKTVTIVGGQGVLSAANPSWPTATFTCRYAVLYKSRGGAASADELILVIDFGVDQVISGTTFTLQWAAAGILLEG